MRTELALEAILVLPAGRELDALVAERVMGLSLIPHRDFAKTRVAARYVSSTGPVFVLTDETRVTVPPGDGLKQPEGTSDWNDRYFFFIAQYLGGRIDDEVNRYRLDPKPYSTSIAAAWEVVEKLSDKLDFYWSLVRESPESWAVYEDPRDLGFYPAIGWGNTAPLAICRAALKAVMG